MTEEQLSQFVQNPNNYIGQQAYQVANQTVAPMAAQVRQMEYATRQFMAARTDEAIVETGKAIGNGYKAVLNKDEAFKTNPQVKGQVEDALKRMHADACREAQSGRFGKLNAFKDPMLFQMTLQAAKMKTGYRPSAKEMARVGKQMVEQASPKSSKHSPGIDANTEAALSRLGEGAKQRYLDSIKNHGDRINWAS